MSTRRIAFVTDELYPFSPGGIGRILHNLIQASLAEGNGPEIHVLAPDYAAFDGQAFEAYFHGRVTLHTVAFREDDAAPAVVGDRHFPPTVAFTDSRLHAQSLGFCLRLLELEARGICFDVIEFPDYRGWAYCCTQERRLGPGLARATVGIRLHSSDGVLQRFEPRDVSEGQTVLFELERKALLDADVVVGHLQQIADFNAAHYGFSPAWLQAVRVEFPPVVWPTPVREAARHRAKGSRQDLLFITKLQPFKRPDLFIQAAAQLMVTRPSFSGRAILACHSFNSQYEQEVHNLVPPELRHRFDFRASGTPEERARLMDGGIVVIPSTYESLNLTAYEVSVAGVPVILNGGCAAFGDDSPFRDGINCFKFDGTVDSLVNAMQRALDSEALSPVEGTVQAPYWRDLAPQGVESTPTRAMLSAVILNEDGGLGLQAAVRSVRESTGIDLEIIVVDNHSLAPVDEEVLASLEGVKAERLVARRHPGAAWNVGLRKATGDYVVLLDAKSAVSPELLKRAVTALEKHPQFAGVVPTLGHFHTPDELELRSTTGFDIFLGDAPSLGLIRNRLSGVPVILRRSMLHELPFDELLDGYEVWDLMLRLVMRGDRLLVTNDVAAFHQGTTVKVSGEAHRERLARMFENLPRTLPASVKLAPLLSPTAGRPIQKRRYQAEETPLRHQIADALNDAVKRLPWVHPLMRRVMKRISS